MKRWSSALTAGLVGMFILTGVTAATADPSIGKDDHSIPGPSLHAQKLRADSKVGPPSGSIPVLESIYVPITPCRVADTRSSTAGIMRHGKSRPFNIRGTTGFSGQGGTSAGCGIPAAATAVTVNTTTLNTTGDGTMTNYPAGATRPKSVFVTYRKGVPITSNPTFALASGSDPSIKIYTSKSSNADLIIDVTGYYIPQIQALVNPSGSIYSGSPRVLSVTKLGTGYFRVETDTDVTYCTPMVHTYYSNEYASASTLSSTGVYVHVWYIDAVTHAETPVDDYFYLTVTC
jgi:hypothetical protein